MSELENSVIFSRGNKIEKNFTGDAYLMMLSESKQPVCNVTFAPKARNYWHKHKEGQILLITGGCGYYQEWGKPAIILHPGDVVEIGAQIKHWHGATADSWFTHIALEIEPSKGPAEWLEPVSDEQYQTCTK